MLTISTPTREQVRRGYPRSPRSDKKNHKEIAAQNVSSTREIPDTHKSFAIESRRHPYFMAKDAIQELSLMVSGLQRCYRPQSSNLRPRKSLMIDIAIQMELAESGVATVRRLGGDRVRELGLTPLVLPPTLYQLQLQRYSGQSSGWE
jgi:hypothetical protein